MIVATVLTNGRIETLDRTISSFEEKLKGGRVTTRIIWDDSGRFEVFDYLRHAYGPRWVVHRSANGAEGFGGAIRSAWAWLNAYTTEPYVFWSEDDFVYEKGIYLDAMAKVLDAHPHLAQLALRRQPWNETEVAAGGVVEVDPDAFTDARDGDHQWIEHRKFFTTNPSLFRRDLLAGGWADDPQSEGRYTHRLLGEGLPWGVPGDQVRFGYYGSRASVPAVTHIGYERTGFGY